MRTESEVRDRLAICLADARLHYPPASVVINAPLALIQVALEEERDILEWVLDDPQSEKEPETCQS